MKRPSLEIKQREIKKKERDRIYAKEWRKKNQDKIKAYLERSKDRRRKVRINYYSKNREELIKKSNNLKKKQGWACEKTGQRKIDALIRSKTRKRFPLKGNSCKFCDNPAEHRHHTTKPIEFDKFDFLCEDHHNKNHGRKTFAKKGVDE